MIINSLKADNFLKYSRLQLENLPKDGVVAISGGNESGKTSIGEAISFVLFGRTFAVDFDKIARVVKWGEETCEVSMNFEVSGKGYQVDRQVDQHGYCNVKLYKLEEGSQALVAEGNSSVADAISEILDYSYAEFIESYYLVQRDIPLPEAAVDAIKRISGVASFEIALTELHQKLDKQKNDKEKQENTRYNLTQEKEQALTFDERMEKLVDEQEKLQQAVQLLIDRDLGLSRFIDKIAEYIEVAKKDAANLAAGRTSSSYTHWIDLLQNLRGTIAEMQQLTPDLADNDKDPTAAILERLIEFEERLVGFEDIYEQLADYREGLGVMLGECAPTSKEKHTIIPIEEQKRLRSEKYRNNIARFITSAFLITLVVISTLSLIYCEYERSSGVIAAIIAGTLILASLYCSLKLRKSYDTCIIQLGMVEEKIGQIKKEAKEIDDLISIPLADAIQYLEKSPVKLIREKASAYINGIGSVLLDENALAFIQRDIQREAKILPAEFSPTIEKVRTEQKEIVQQKRVSEENLKEVETSIQQMRDDTRSLEQIDGDIKAINNELEEKAKAIELTYTAIDLAKEGAENQAKVFSDGVAKWVTNALKHFTAGKYSEVRINEQLNVIVYSSQKGDFMEFDEVSSGTRRQILLAVRIAISQELCDSRKNGRQMLFLDEPLAFFDKDRASSTLKALPNLSDELSQIWIVNQEFVTDEGFGVHIRCEEENDTLQVTC